MDALRGPRLPALEESAIPVGEGRTWLGSITTLDGVVLSFEQAEFGDDQPDVLNVHATSTDANEWTQVPLGVLRDFGDGSLSAGFHRLVTEAKAIEYGASEPGVPSPLYTKVIWEVPGPAQDALS